MIIAALGTPVIDWLGVQRALAEFIGMAGLTFILSRGAASLVRYRWRSLQPGR